MFSTGLLIVYSSLLWKSYYCAYSSTEDIAMRIKMNILLMESEIVKDAIVKITSVQHYRDRDYLSTAYQVGETLATIKALLSRVIELYNRVIQQSFPRVTQVEKLSEAHRIFFEIDNLVKIMENWESTDQMSKPLGSENTRRSEELLTKLNKEDSERLEGKEPIIPVKVPSTPSSRAADHMKRKNKIWRAAKI